MTDPAPTAAPRPGPWAAETAADWSDAKLLHGLRAGERAALEELYIRYFPPAYALAVRMLDDPNAAEECVQEVFLQLWSPPPPADPPGGDVCAWVLQAIHQHARTRQHDPLTRRPPRAADPPSLAAAASPTGPGRFAARCRLIEQQQAARVALATLSPVERTVLEWAYFRSMTRAEIAAALPEESCGTVQTHLRTGLDRLRAALTGEAAPVLGGDEAVSRAPASPAGVPSAPPAPARSSPPSSSLGQLADALAGMKAAQQQAAGLRHRAQDVQRRAHLAQQRAAAQQQRATTTLQQLAVLQELYAYLDTALAERPPPGAPPFVYTAAYFAQHPANIAVCQVVAILAALNAQSDREAHRLLPTLLR